MIYTVTFNPSLDYICYVHNFVEGTLNRTCNEIFYPGGKGINVSRVLYELDIPSKALGFIAGFVGKELERMIRINGIDCDFIEVKEGVSRMNIKLKSTKETEINGIGPIITDDAIKRLYQKVDKIKPGDFLVLSGSIPHGISKSVYSDLVYKFQGEDINCVVDTTKDTLVSVLQYHPFLIKPNHHELGDIFDTQIKTKEEATIYAKKLQEMGARNVLVSMAQQGAILLTDDGMVLEHKGIEGKVKNSVGSGDSMVAGFIAGYLKHHSYQKALEMGIAAGSATAFSEDLATKKEILLYFEDGSKNLHTGIE